MCHFSIEFVDCARFFLQSSCLFSSPHPTCNLADCFAFPRHVYPTESTPLWSVQQCVFTVVRAQHPVGFPPAGAIKGAAHRRCDCTAFSRGGSGRGRREKSKYEVHAGARQIGAVILFLGIKTGCLFTEMIVILGEKKKRAFFIFLIDLSNMPDI